MPVMAAAWLSDMLEDLKNQPSKLATGLGAATGIYLFWKYFPRSPQQSWPHLRVSPHADIYPEKQRWAARKRNAHRSFPKPYPNSWVYIFPSETVRKGTAVPVDVCGKQLVAFRGDRDGILGVLDAYCSHMGTHLGYGSLVSDNSIKCPYHLWSFDKDGKLKNMPYGGQHDCGREGNNIRSYPVVEKEGMVFVWLHADHAEPWPLTCLDYPKDNDLRPITRIIENDYYMHPMEPSHNSVDWYHFSTVHSALSTHWLSNWKMIDVDQHILPPRSWAHKSKDDDGQDIERKELLVIDEKITGMRLFNKTIHVPGKYVESFSSSQVRLYGPLVINFHIKIKFLGEFLGIMPLTPVEPFRTHLEIWSFASEGFPWIVAYMLSHMIKFTVSQDREVWEHRVHRWPRNQVKGDYSFSKYDKWLQYFYTESSISWDDLDKDLSW
jgi:phenylpropionate dioxygenase-like ring-hydroxylating dioxygenase large terminal subunit